MGVIAEPLADAKPQSFDVIIAKGEYWFVGIDSGIIAKQYSIDKGIYPIRAYTIPSTARLEHALVRVTITPPGSENKSKWTIRSTLHKLAEKMSGTDVDTAKSTTAQTTAVDTTVRCTASSGIKEDEITPRLDGRERIAEPVLGKCIPWPAQPGQPAGLKMWHIPYVKVDGEVRYVVIATASVCTDFEKMLKIAPIYILFDWDDSFLMVTEDFWQPIVPVILPTPSNHTKSATGSSGKYTGTDSPDNTPADPYAGLSTRADVPTEIKEIKSELGDKHKKVADPKTFTVQVTDLKEDVYKAKSVVMTMPYLYFEPKKVPHGTKVPLVVFLHGRGANVTKNKEEMKHNKGPLVFVQPETQKKYPCYFLSPINPTPWAWPDPRFNVVTDYMKSAMEIVDMFVEKYPDIDKDRIYITGLSSGAAGTWDAISKFPGKFAAAVPISGDWDPDVMRQKEGIAVWAFYNRLENGIERKWDVDRMLRKVVAMGGIARKTMYMSASHNAWANAYAEPDLVPWLFKQKRFRPK